MITFVEFLELCESSTGESGRRRVSSRGPSANRSDRNKQRQDNSNRAALSKAGFSRSPRPVTGKGGRKTKWTETSTSSHHDTETGTYANQSDYATSKIGNLGPKGNKPTSKRALKAKQIRKQLGGDRTPRQVHDVAVNKKRTYDDDNSSTMTKGRSFRKEVTKGVSDNLKKAGAKSGDIVTSTPTSDSRSRMYGKTHNTKTSKRTGVTVNRIREWIDILEAKKHPIPDTEYKQWQKDREEGKGPASKEFDGVKYQMRGKGTDKKTGKRRWAVSTVADRKNQGSTRTKKERETQVSQDELRDTAKKEIDKPNSNERAAAAYDAEQTRMRRINKRVTKIGKNTGVKQSKDHIQPLQRKTSNPDNQERLDKVLPGHNTDNLAIKDLSKNSSKQNDAPKKGESGSTLTRASVKRKQLNRGDKLLDKVGREISSTQSGRGSRAARLLSYLRRDRTPRPDTGAARRMNAAGKKLNLPD